MFPAYCQIVDLDIVVRFAADGGTFLGQRDFLQDQAVHTEYQLRHSSIPLLKLFEPAHHLAYDAARRGVIPLSICSWRSEWSFVTCLSSSPRSLYIRESPMCATVILLS